MTAALLRPDCARCAALCCVAFAFERSADFAIDKPAEAPCPKLDACGRCRIYARRQDRGFGGCIQYDCLGAGQRVVQQTFGGEAWMDDPALLRPMLRAFETMRGVHELLALLGAARDAGLADGHVERIGSFEVRLDAIAEVAAQAHAARKLRQTDQEIRAFLTRLRPYFGENGRHASDTGQNLHNEPSTA